MDDLLARERAAHEYVKSLQNHDEVPFKTVLAAFDEYRSLAQQVIFANFSDAEKQESRLWQQHTESRQVLARTLRKLRKMPDEKIVEIRVANEMYLRFVKQSMRYYRSYVYELSIRYGGIPELQAVAHQVKPDSSASQTTTDVSPELRKQVLLSCHRTLIYLGDLCRYRASDDLDKSQDFGPALGFYGLACTIRPESGWGHNQQGIVALEQRKHLHAIYHLYRSFLVADPVLMAKKNLRIQFDKVNMAWEKGELIDKASPGDTEAGKRALTGWFVRLHSLCVSGERVRGYEELERELLSRLSNELRQNSLDFTLIRMVFVNIGAQHTAMENYREIQTPQNENAFYSFLRVNVKFFTELLALLQEDLLKAAADPRLVGSELSDKLKPIMSGILPALRLYSHWLLLNTHLLVGLSAVELLNIPLENFWLTYARVLDLIAAVFPIWDLEDIAPVTYMLEEDAETLGYLPLQHDENEITLLKKVWFDAETGLKKPRFSDFEIVRTSAEQESLSRVLGLLETGSFVANNIDDTPLHIRGPRFVLGHDAEPFALPRPPTPPKPEKPKPLSYAAAAAKKRAVAAKATKQTSSPKPQAKQDASHDPKMSHMVDSLIEDEDTDNPKTPPQQFVSNPAVMTGASDAELSLHDTTSTKLGIAVPASPMNISSPTQFARQDQYRSRANVKEDLSDFVPRPKVPGRSPGSATGLWIPPDSVGDKNRNRRSSASPAHRLHKRAGSSTSIASPHSPALNSRWPSDENVTKSKHNSRISFTGGLAASTALHKNLTGSAQDRILDTPMQNNDAAQGSPLLFGNGSIWGVVASPGARNDHGG